MERQLDAPRRAACCSARSRPRASPCALEGADTARDRRHMARRGRSSCRTARTIAADAVVVAVGIRAERRARAHGRHRGQARHRGRRPSRDQRRRHPRDRRMRRASRLLLRPGRARATSRRSVLARRLAGVDARYRGSVLATNLKVSGVNVFSAGDFLGAHGHRGDRAQRSGRRRLQEAGHRGRSPGRRGAVRRYRRRPLVSRSDPLRHRRSSAARRPRVRRARSPRTACVQ